MGRYGGQLKDVRPDDLAAIVLKEVCERAHVKPSEVEEVISKHPDVLEVAVIAVPDAKWGEVPKAFVVAKEGRHPTADDIVAHCRRLLAHFKCPKAVEFGPLPQTSTGKVQKFVLREREWSGHEKRIH